MIKGQNQLGAEQVPQFTWAAWLDKRNEGKNIIIILQWSNGARYMLTGHHIHNAVYGELWQESGDNEECKENGEPTRLACKCEGNR